jgi:alpha-ketoglutarate-dependent taurine dioxygenase
MAKDIRIEPIDATFGAVVTNLDLRDVDDAAVRALHAEWLRYALLIFPAQHLTMSEQETFARHFGRVNPTFQISNVDPNGEVWTDRNGARQLDMLRGNYDWHADATFMPVQSKGAVYSAQVVPPQGGQTGWADMRAAYDALDERTRMRVEGLQALHSIRHSQARRGLIQQDDYALRAPENPVRPIVKVHSETGRRSLLIGRHAYSIPSMDEAESEAFLQELTAFACQPPRLHFHDWAPGDLVMWDNRCLLHCVKPWDMSEPRVLWHTALSGDPVAEAILA